MSKDIASEPFFSQCDYRSYRGRSPGLVFPVHISESGQFLPFLILLKSKGEEGSCLEPK